MVVGFTTTYSISAYHHYGCEFESRSWRGVLDTTLCDYNITERPTVMKSNSQTLKIIRIFYSKSNAAYRHFVSGRIMMLNATVPITTMVVSLNHAHGEVYLIQHYVIKYVSDLRQVSTKWYLKTK
jgi:hypothetical protein